MIGLGLERGSRGAGPERLSGLCPCLEDAQSSVSGTQRPSPRLHSLTQSLRAQLLHAAVGLQTGLLLKARRGKVCFLGGGGFTRAVRKALTPRLAGNSLLQPLWDGPTFCNACQVHSGLFHSSGLCHPLPKLCSVQDCTPDFPQALLDILTASLCGKRFLHHRHHFYILYNIMADDKSILLITHPACYNPHKKHEQLEKP